MWPFRFTGHMIIEQFWVNCTYLKVKLLDFWICVIEFTVSLYLSVCVCVCVCVCVQHGSQLHTNFTAMKSRLEKHQISAK